MRTIEELEQGNSGDHTEGLKTLDEKAIEDPKLVNTMEGRLAHLRELENGLDAEQDDVDPESKTPTPDVPEDGSEEENNGQAVVDGKVDDIPGEESNTDSEDAPVSIPDAYVRAAIHNGWKQEEVDELVKANPELALRTMGACHNSVINANKEWSALGRAKIDEERRLATEAKPVVQDVDPDLQPLLDRLKVEHPDDPLIETVAKLLAAPKPAQVVTQPQQSKDLYGTATARANAAANASVDQTINTFFGLGDMAPYEEFYGKVGLSQSIKDLTNGQQEHRLAVLDEAECIMTGLRMRGIDVSVEQVLEKAHLLVTEPIREQIIRGNLKKSAVARQKGITLRPANSKKTGAVSNNSQQKPRNRQELIDKVQQKLANLPGLRS